jgi:hypothetical protein
MYMDSTPTEHIGQLLDTLHRFNTAHRHAQQAAEVFAEIDRQLKAVKVHIRANATGSNQAKRDAEEAHALQTEWHDLSTRHQSAERIHREATAEVERLLEELKTRRSLLAYETATIEMDRASTEATGALRLIRKS